MHAAHTVQFNARTNSIRFIVRILNYPRGVILLDNKYHRHVALSNWIMTLGKQPWKAPRKEALLAVLST
jgi:hypothetical protein